MTFILTFQAFSYVLQGLGDHPPPPLLYDLDPEMHIHDAVIPLWFVSVGGKWLATKDFVVCVMGIS